MCMCQNINQKSNGNLVLAYIDIEDSQLKLLELYTSGSIVRQYPGSHKWTRECCVNLADSNDGMMLASSFEVIELLLNLISLVSIACSKTKTSYFLSLNRTTTEIGMRLFVFILIGTLLRMS